MSDKSIKVGDCNVLLIDGNIISIDEGDYVNSYSMTVDEWEQIKAAVDHLIYEANNEKANPTTTCREVSAIHGQENQS